MTGFAFQGKGAFTASTLPTLASFIGYMPATLNMFNCTGHDGKQPNGFYTDFQSSNTAGNFISWWTTPGASISVTNKVAFDGTPNVQKLVENSSNSVHSITAGTGPQDKLAYHPVPFRVMVIAAAAERTRIVVDFSQTSPTDAQATTSVGFDLAGGNTGYDVVNGTHMTVTGQQMINLGTIGGLKFWACIFDWVWNTANTGTGRASAAFIEPTIFLDNGSGTAARSTTYTGDGASGAYIFLVHMLPKAIWTHNWAKNFFDDFNSLSTIDRSNTGAPGFNWYINGDFGVSSSPSGFWHPEPSTDPASFSLIQPSILKFQTPAPFPGGNFHGNLSSVVSKGSGSGLASLNGNYWAPPLAFDGFLTYDSQTTNAGGYLNNTAFWSVSAETLAGSPLDGSGHYTEWDLCDNGQNTNQLQFNYWNNTALNSTVQTFTPAVGSSNVIPSFPPFPNLNQLFRLTGIWLDAASGASGAAGWGLFCQFINGTMVDQGSFHIFLYQTAGLTHPAPTAGVDLSGAFSASDSQHAMLFLWSPTAINNIPGLSLGVETHWDWVAVWQ